MHGAGPETGLANLFVSNGYMTAECSRELASLLDGINIDIKSFSEDFYHKVCKASLQPVLDTVRLMRELGYLGGGHHPVIPGLNDSAEGLAGIASFLSAGRSRHSLACHRFSSHLYHA